MFLKCRQFCFKNEKMSRYCHNASLKSKHVFTQGRTCYEIHAGFVKCLWKHCFVQIITLTDLSSRCPELQSEAGSWKWPSWDLSKWKSCKSRLFNTHYHGLGYNCIHLILLCKSTDIAILAVQAFKISCSDLKRWPITKFPNLVKKSSEKFAS